MRKYKIPSILKAFIVVLIYTIIAALCRCDITMALAVLVAVYVVQNRILLRRYLDAVNNDEETEEE